MLIAGSSPDYTGISSKVPQGSLFFITFINDLNKEIRGNVY